MVGLRYSIALMLFTSASSSAWAIDAYLVAGQSNGWRISHLKQGPEEKKGPKVYYFGMDCVSEPDTAKLVTLTNLHEGTMGYGLAQALVEKSGKDIVFIQYCRCGASVLNPAVNGWWPGDDPAGGKVFDEGLFGRFQSYLKSARAQVKQELNEELEFKGMFWHQGESDAESDKVKFQATVTNLFGRFRGELGENVPIIAGHIRELREGSRAINTTLDAIAKQDAKMLTVPLTGLEFAPDREGRPDVHIALSGCHELGRRMVRALDTVEVRASVTAAGGTVELAASDASTIIGLNLYNGNNPLKGQGGRNALVTDDWVEKLAGFRTLKKLNLSNCAITNQAMKHVGKFTALEELNLTLTAISDEGLQHLGNLTQLRVLGLASSQCTGAGFVHLKNLKHLENVNFHYTPLNDDGLRAISSVGVQGRLWFAHVKFTDEGALSLAKLSGLKSCGIGSNHPESSGKSVASLVGLPLENLSLLDNQATPEGIAHAATISTLRVLDVSHAPKANDESLKQVSQLPRLEEFRIGSSPDITDAGLLALASSKSLKKLTLIRLKNVTEPGLAALRKARPDLTIEVK